MTQDGATQSVAVNTPRLLRLVQNYGLNEACAEHRAWVERGATHTAQLWSDAIMAKWGVRPASNDYASMVDAVLNAQTIGEANDAADALALAFPDRMRDMSRHYDAERFGRPCSVVDCELDH